MFLQAVMLYRHLCSDGAESMRRRHLRMTFLGRLLVTVAVLATMLLLLFARSSNLLRGMLPEIADAVSVAFLVLVIGMLLFPSDLLIVYALRKIAEHRQAEPSRLFFVDVEEEEVEELRKFHEATKDNPTIR